MKKSELKQLIKEVYQELNEWNNYAYRCIDYNYLMKVGITEEDLKKITDIYNDIANKTGDEGPCVLGNGVKVNGKFAISSYSQGSIGLEIIQKEIIPFLRKKYPKLKITYEWGNMD